MGVQILCGLYLNGGSVLKFHEEIRSGVESRMFEGSVAHQR